MGASAPQSVGGVGRGPLAMPMAGEEMMLALLCMHVRREVGVRKT